MHSTGISAPHVSRLFVFATRGATSPIFEFGRAGIRHKPKYSLLVHLIIITTVDQGLLLCQLRLHVPPRPSCSSLSAQLSGATVDYSSARTSANLIRSSLDNNAGSSGSAKAAALIDVDGGGSDNHGVETVRSLPTNWKA